MHTAIRPYCSLAVIPRNGHKWSPDSRLRDGRSKKNELKPDELGVKTHIEDIAKKARTNLMPRIRMYCARQGKEKDIYIGKK